jgi:hypothetical protein
LQIAIRVEGAEVAGRLEVRVELPADAGDDVPAAEVAFDAGVT